MARELSPAPFTNTDGKDQLSNWLTAGLVATAAAVTLNAIAAPIAAESTGTIFYASLLVYVLCLAAVIHVVIRRPRVADARVPLIVILAATLIYALAITGLVFAAPTVPISAWLTLIAGQLIACGWAYFFVGYLVRNNIQTSR